MIENIEIKSKVNNKEIENLFVKLNSQNAGEINFAISKETTLTGFGTFPSLIILFFTWLRLKKGNFIIKIDPNNKADLKNFAENYLGYVMLLSAWKHRVIVDMNGNSIRSNFKEFTKEFHKKIDFLTELPNDNLVIPLFDHYSKEQGFSHWFYTDTYEFPPSPKSLDNSIYRIFEEVGKIYKARLNQNSQAILDDLQDVIWELVGNTHNHATKDYLNRIELSPNVRGAYFKIHRSTKENFIKDADEHEGLKEYYRSVLIPGTNFILEISVFDSGPGLAKRYMGGKWSNELGINEEVLNIKKCLEKGTSSVNGASGKARGFGLNNVLSTLSKKSGFLKIRSGRASIYRDLKKTPHFSIQKFEEIELQDWESGDIQKFTSMAPAEGTIITMTYPLIDIS